MANANLVKVAIHQGLKHYMLAPLPRGKGAKKRAELGLAVSLFPRVCSYSTGTALHVPARNVTLVTIPSMFNDYQAALWGLPLHDGVLPCLQNLFLHTSLLSPKLSLSQDAS